MKKIHHHRLQADRRPSTNNKRGYTLVELCVVLGILLVLSTIGLVFYQATLAHARGTVCQTNLKTLKKAVEEHAMENDALPATLGQIKRKHIENAYVKAIDEIGWFAKFSLFLLKLEDSGQAHAQFLSHENLSRYGASKKVFNCPSDDNDSPSYGINAALEGKKWSEVAQDAIIVADSDFYVFTNPDQLAKRHNHSAFAIRLNGEIVELADAEKSALENPEPEVSAADDDEVTICHNGKTTKTKSGPDLDAHLAHGDTLGACPE